MADYLLPQATMSIVDQRELFSIRFRTNTLGANRGTIEYCETKCEEILNNSHVFQCVKLNINGHKYDMNKVLNGYIVEKKQHLRIWRDYLRTHYNYLLLRH